MSDARRPRVLLIDDTLDQLDLYELVLADRFDTLRATRGATGYNVATVEQPDVIVLDLLLPDVDGWTLCRLLKTHPRTASIPVLVLTALDDQTAHQRAYRAGAHAVLTKATSITAVEAQIAQAAGAAT